MCLEVSPGTWGADPVPHQRFATQNRRSSEKCHPDISQAPTSQARSRDKEHLRPSSLAARALSFMKHTLPKFDGDVCAVRQGITADVKCFVRKERFSLVYAANRNDPSIPTALQAGFSTMKKNAVLFSVISCDNHWPDRPIIMESANRKQNGFAPLRCSNLPKALASLASLVLFHSQPRQRKTFFSHTTLNCCGDSSPHRTRVSTERGERMLH